MSGGDPLSRLRFCVEEIDRVFGGGFARENPALVGVVMQTAASDFAALAISHSLDNIAGALLEDVAELEPRGALVRPSVRGVIR
jgi:hypothetical protein